MLEQERRDADTSHRWHMLMIEQEPRLLVPRRQSKLTGLLSDHLSTPKSKLSPFFEVLDRKNPERWHFSTARES